MGDGFTRAGFTRRAAEVIRANATARGWSASLPTKLARLLAAEVGGADLEVIAATGSAYFYLCQRKVRVSAHHQRSTRLKRGVDVDLVLPARSDSGSVGAFVGRLEEARVALAEMVRRERVEAW